MSSLAWIALATVLAGAPPDFETRLLDAARAAAALGDGTSAEALVFAWAGLVRASAPPAESVPGAEAALVRAWSEGPFRLFGSRLEDRVRVGLHDPARLVDRLDVFLDTPAGPRLMTLLPSPAGRLEYGVDGPLPAGGDVRIVALSARLGALEPFREVVLPPPAALGLPPPPGAVATSSVGVAGPETGAVDPSAAEIEWPWWLAGAAVAVGLVGAAVWQETRGP